MKTTKKCGGQKEHNSDTLSVKARTELIVFPCKKKK